MDGVYVGLDASWTEGAFDLRAEEGFVEARSESLLDPERSIWISDSLYLCYAHTLTEPFDLDVIMPSTPNKARRTSQSLR